MKNDRVFIIQSKLTSLRLGFKCTILVGETKLKIKPEQMGAKHPKGCWGCYFNRNTKFEDGVIQKCNCLAKDNSTPVKIYNKRHNESNFTLHDLYCACTGIQSIIYTKY